MKRIHRNLEDLIIRQVGQYLSKNDRRKFCTTCSRFAVLMDYPLPIEVCQRLNSWSKCVTRVHSLKDVPSDTTSVHLAEERTSSIKPHEITHLTKLKALKLSRRFKGNVQALREHQTLENVGHYGTKDLSLPREKYFLIQRCDHCVWYNSYFSCYDKSSGYDPSYYIDAMPTKKEQRQVTKQKHVHQQPHKLKGRK